jgi:hypothetical protein
MDRYIVQALPVMLVGGILVVMTATRCLQLVQSRVLHVLPFGALGSVTLSDICVGILISGLFMLYFGGWRPLSLLPRLHGFRWRRQQHRPASRTHCPSNPSAWGCLSRHNAPFPTPCLLPLSPCVPCRPSSPASPLTPPTPPSHPSPPRYPIYHPQWWYAPPWPPSTARTGVACGPWTRSPPSCVAGPLALMPAWWWWAA